MYDSTIIRVAPSPDTSLEETVKLAQKGLNIFSGESKATGVQVSTEKKKCHLMDFKWHPEGKCRLSYREAKLTPQSKYGGKEIEILSPKKSPRILGVWISQDGSSK